MRIAAANEVRAGETRVALTPGVVPLLLRDGHEVLVASGAGAAAHTPDEHYVQSGGRIVDSPAELYAQADAIFRVHPPSGGEIALMRPRTICIGLLDPLTQTSGMAALAHQGVIAYALELVPRIARAQSMDALTSMATIAGYKAVLLAADRLDKLFPLMMTAAGTVAPAAVLVLGAGVAGLQAIATAKRLGARVIAFDPRPAVREQVQSLGATFLAMEVSEDVETASGYAREQSEALLQRERTSIAERLPQTDVVICTAQVAGKRAPVLVTAEMVRLLRPGAVVVDLAADQGGNCELTQAGCEAEHGGVVVIGAGNLPALVPADASQLYAHNLVNLFRYLYPAKGFPPDTSDEIVREVCVTRDGQIVNATVRTALATEQQGVLA
jgi:NAD(P) transhydrogenase subunit alpha